MSEGGLGPRVLCGGKGRDRTIWAVCVCTGGPGAADGGWGMLREGVESQGTGGLTQEESGDTGGWTATPFMDSRALQANKDLYGRHWCCLLYTSDAADEVCRV